MPIKTGGLSYVRKYFYTQYNEEIAIRNETLRHIRKLYF